MKFRPFALIVVLGVLLWSGAATAQKPGGTLHFFLFDSPASMSIHEESTIAGQAPIMPVFNNLVMFDQHVPQSGIDSIVPDLATEWAWDDGKTRLTFKLRPGVKWHDGQPFTADDVKCTFDLLLGRAAEKLRLNPRKPWYRNLDQVIVSDAGTVAFQLKRPQPSFIVMLASGFTAIYPCHVPPHEMRQHPIGTGPFKFVEFRPNEYIKLARNPDYWKKDRPYLDGIEWTIIKNLATSELAFLTGAIDITSPFYFQVPLINDIRKRDPSAVCIIAPVNVNRNVMINRTRPPLSNPELRRAVALSLDRQAFIETLTQGKGDIGATMLPPPEGIWGMPLEMVRQLPGYDPDIAKNRAAARKVMEKNGYAQDNHLKIKVSARNIDAYRDPAVILIDQLKQIYIDGELETVDSPSWFPKVARKDYTIAANLTGYAVDDPDVTFYENYACGSENNYDGYCNPEIDKLFDQQSAEFDQQKRKQMVWEIERRLAEDVARPVLYHNRSGTCWQPFVKGYTPMVNSIYNGLRMEDVWLDK